MVDQLFRSGQSETQNLFASAVKTAFDHTVLFEALQAVRESRETLMGDALEASRRCEDLPASIEEFHRRMRRLGDLIGCLPEPKGKTRGKKSTVSGEARAKIIGALTAWHKYENGGCGNTTPIGVGKLAELAKVSKGSVTPFFNREFRDGKKGGHTVYQRQCQTPTTLIHAIMMINGDLRPSILSGPAYHENVGDDPADSD
jgi:hypothetical protein